MLAFLGVWSSSIVFCGLVFRGEDVVWPFRLFYYVMPLKWTFGSAGYDLFMPSDFTGAETCVPGAAITYSDGTTATCSSAGFCDGMQSSFGCWGRTGEQVLDTLHKSYQTLTSDDHRGRDLGVLRDGRRAQTGVHLHPHDEGVRHGLAPEAREGGDQDQVREHGVRIPPRRNLVVDVA